MGTENKQEGGKPSNLETEIALIRSTFVSDPIPLSDGRSLILHAAGLTARVEDALNPTLASDIDTYRVFIEPSSMIEYIKAYQQHAVVFAYPESVEGPKFEARLNYHERIGDVASAGVPAGPVVTADRHVAVLKTPFDVDYQKWRPYLHGTVAIKQVDFGILIENMAHTIATPDAGPLQELILDLEMRKNVAFKNKTNLRDGTTKLQFEETVESDPSHAGAQGAIVLPNSIVLRMPIYQGGEPVDIEALLRFQLQGSTLFFSIRCPTIARIEREEFRNIGDDIATACDVPVLYSEE